MFMGHFATALVPYEKLKAAESQLATTGTPVRAAPFWLFLLASQVLDFIMLIFVAMGIESFTPSEFNPLTSKFYEMQTDMTYSHDLVPVTLWAIAFSIISFLITKRTVVALWTFGLIIFHEILDLVVGFKHFINGEGTAEVGLALYTQAPLTGLIIETVLCAAIVWWFIRSRENRGVPVSAKLQRILYILLVGGTLSMLPLFL